MFCDNIKNLLDSDIIVISSPTDFHFEQIKELQDFNGYIFCEKPIVGTLEEIKKIRYQGKSKKIAQELISSL